MSQQELVRVKEFTIGQVATFFFDRDTQWIRYRERQLGWTIGKRKPNDKPGDGDRIYTLDDIAAMADELRAVRILDEENHGIVLARVESQRSRVHTKRMDRGEERDG